MLLTQFLKLKSTNSLFQAVNILTEFYWLKTNAGVILTENSSTAGGCDSVVGAADSSAQQLAREEWHIRRLKFNNCVADIKRAFDRLCASVNREVGEEFSLSVTHSLFPSLGET